MSALEILWQGDAVTRGVAVLMLLMSVTSWVLILWKGRMLLRAARDCTLCVNAFWQSPDLAAASLRIHALDREQVVAPLVMAAQAQPGGSLAAQGSQAQRVTRTLRDALHLVLQRLQAGQVVLATIGATAPFVGLLGTVWGIYHALTGLGASQGVSIEKVAGPVGEALIMTAAGLAVAIPAVLGYNLYGRLISRIEADL